MKTKENFYFEIRLCGGERKEIRWFSYRICTEIEWRWLLILLIVKIAHYLNMKFGFWDHGCRSVVKSNEIETSDQQTATSPWSNPGRSNRILDTKLEYFQNHEQCSYMFCTNQFSSLQRRRKGFFQGGTKIKNVRQRKKILVNLIF